MIKANLAKMSRRKKIRSRIMKNKAKAMTHQSLTSKAHATGMRTNLKKRSSMTPCLASPRVRNQRKRSQNMSRSE